MTALALSTSIPVSLTLVSVFMLTGLLPSNGDEALKSGIEFCDGKSYYQAPASVCKSGYKFGNRKPKPSCICFRGIYRLHLSDCRLEEGFADGICKTALDTTGARIHSIELTPVPDWTVTAVVSESNWEVTGLGNKIMEGGSSFYTINGQAYFNENRHGKEFICVERSPEVGETEVCRIFQKDNLKIWTEGHPIEITVSGTPCSSNVVSSELLKPRTCGPPLTEVSSECELECDRFGTNSMGGKSASNCTEGSVTFDNNFLDRTMTEHAMMIQMGEIEPIALPEPNRTFSLLKVMTQITNGFCPDPFVPSDWVNHMAELFLVLHRGREFQYEEFLSVEDYNWIHEILTSCASKGHRIELTNGPGHGGSECTERDDGGKAYGYCAPTEPTCSKPIRILPIPEKAGTRLRSKHYVPELVWSIIDITQAICFGEFSQSYRMFHLLEQASEKLFTEQVMNLWYNPPYLKNSRHKSVLVGPASDEIMHNLEVCTGAAYHQTNEQNRLHRDATVIPRLVRPTKSTYLRRKRRSGSEKSDSKSASAFCVKTKSEFSVPENC